MNKEWLKRLRKPFYALWVLCGLYFLARTGYEVISAADIADYETHKGYPATNPKKLESDFAEIDKVALGPMLRDRDSALYFQILGRLDDMENSCRRMEHEDLANSGLYRASVMEVRAKIDALFMRLDLKKGRELFDLESAKYRKIHPITIPQAPCDRSKVWPLIVEGYLFFILFTYGHNCIVLKRNGCSVWYEMTKDDPEFWYYPVIFPIGWFKYPYDVHPGQQVAKVCRLLLRTASLLLSAAISICAQLGVLAKKANAQSSDCQTTEDCYRLDLSTRSKSQYLGSYVADIFYPGWVQQSSATLSFPGFKSPLLKGLSFNIWNSFVPNTRPFGSGFGSEVDLSAGWSGKLHGFNVAAGFTYIDVYPLVVLPRGDVVEATLTLSKVFKPRSNIVVEPYLFNAVAAPARGKTPNGGLITHSGANLEWRLLKWLVFRANPHAIHDSGAFGEKEGYLFGGNADVGIKLSKRLTFHPLEIDTGLPIAVHDKRRNRAVFGFGFDYGFAF